MQAPLTSRSSSVDVYVLSTLRETYSPRRVWMPLKWLFMEWA